ncbi:MAG: hypothetical protein ACQCN6_03500 [Candidatus Bathyarchaeia archaeon]|jgi:hypothetical protein
MSRTNIPQKQLNSTSLALPIEEQSVRTTLNIKKSNLEGLTRIGASKHLTLTAMTNEALKDFCAKMNNVQKIDYMISETNGYWSTRDLNRVLKLLPIETVKAMIPYQIASLYRRLRDNQDRERVFIALALTDELQQINALNDAIQKASIFEGEKLQSCNIYKLAIELKAKLTPLQLDYLTIVFGKDAMEILLKRRPDIIPDETLPDDSQKEEAADDEETQELENAESVPILDEQ